MQVTPIVVGGIYERLWQACGPFAMQNPWQRVRVNSAVRRCPDDLQSVFDSLQRDFPALDLITSGVASRGEDGELFLSERWPPSGRPIIALRVADDALPYDLLTPLGCVSGRMPIVAAMDDPRMREAIADRSWIAVGREIEDVIALISQGVPATLATGLDAIDADRLSSLCAKLGWHWDRFGRRSARLLNIPTSPGPAGGPPHDDSEVDYEYSANENSEDDATAASEFAAFDFSEVSIVAGFLAPHFFAPDGCSSRDCMPPARECSSDCDAPELGFVTPEGGYRSSWPWDCVSQHGDYVSLEDSHEGDRLAENGPSGGYWSLDNSPWACGPSADTFSTSSDVSWVHAPSTESAACNEAETEFAADADNIQLMLLRWSPSRLTQLPDDCWYDLREHVAMLQRMLPIEDLPILEWRISPDALEKLQFMLAFDPESSLANLFDDSCERDCRDLVAPPARPVPPSAGTLGSRYRQASRMYFEAIRTPYYTGLKSVSELRRDCVALADEMFVEPLLREAAKVRDPAQLAPLVALSQLMRLTLHQSSNIEENLARGRRSEIAPAIAEMLKLAKATNLLTQAILKY